MTRQRAKAREAYRALEQGEYHFCTDGLKGADIFYSIADYALGMILMGLICIKYCITIYAFTLMPNHIHIILSGTGANCLRAFDYLKRKLSARLKKTGHAPLPKDYWFKLERIDSPEQMRREIIYVLRNALEKGLAQVAGWLWGSGWIYHSDMCSLLRVAPAWKPAKYTLEKMLGGVEHIPENWHLHKYLGLLPDSFVDTSLVYSLFPSPKDLQTALVKDYEVYFQMASRLGEVVSFSNAEIENIVEQTLQKRFDGRALRALSDEDRGKLAIILNREFGLSSYQISTSIYIKEKTVRQLLSSKELR